MIPKQDMTGARTPADIDRKYGAKFSQVLGIAEESRNLATDAKNNVSELDKSLGQDGIFNRLTNNGAAKGMYRDSEGNIYFNADYIKSGKLIAQMVNALNENGDFVKIEDGKIVSGNGGTEYFSLRPASDGTGAWILTFNNEVEQQRVRGSMTWDTIELGAVEQDSAPFFVKAYGHYSDPTVNIQLPVAGGRVGVNLLGNLYAYWNDNGDGTFSIVGYENKLQGG